MSERDDALIVRYLEGETGAFETLYHRYAARLLGFVVSLGAPRDAAEDIAQRTWLKVIDAIEQYKPTGRFRPWLFTVAHRMWIDETRSPWRRRRVAMEGGTDSNPAWAPISALIDPRKGPRQSAAEREEREQVGAALEELPDAMRQTVLLRIDADMTFREIAETMNCPLGTVLWRMNEATRRLTQRLGNTDQKEGTHDGRG